MQAKKSSSRSEVTNKTVQRVDGVEIDRNGDKFAVDAGEHSLVGAPFDEVREIFEYVR